MCAVEWWLPSLSGQWVVWEVQELFCAAALRMAEVMGLVLPTPVVISLCVFFVSTLIILDTGSGSPIFYPFLRPFFRPYTPSPTYERLKSKFL